MDERLLFILYNGVEKNEISWLVIPKICLYGWKLVALKLMTFF